MTGDTLARVAPSSVIKFTDEILENLTGGEDKITALVQKVLSSAFCLFLPSHRRNVTGRPADGAWLRSWAQTRGGRARAAGGGGNL